MALRDILLDNPSFSFEKNIFHQKGQHSESFEATYLELRGKENRIYSDDELMKLPDYEGIDSLRQEWRARKNTLGLLIKAFKKRPKGSLILELGCGNGWMSHRLATSLDSEILGLDVNNTELTRAANVFKTCSNLLFMKGDVFTVDIKKGTFDIILVASSAQYFPDLKHLVSRLLELLSPSGEIHFVDSPFYSTADEVLEAKMRSAQYFDSRGYPAMIDFYFHHTLAEIRSFKPRMLLKPTYIISKVKKLVFGIPQNTFPWILIKRP
jgi:ubiquinone/menaquinone biosynthesis C-methylase UbiE